MCGIAGFWNKNEEVDKDIIISMIETLKHRGPDDMGVYINRGLALGHRRLSILDLSPLGHQPMESKRYVIVYNGEIYNFNELKKELNYNFKSHTDTEVILASVEEWGIEKTINRFNGMFAFVLYDKIEEKLYLVRDRLGIKPLYFGVQGNTLFFASELKAIRAHKDFKAFIDRDSLALYFRYGYIPTPYSIYQDVNKLMPAHYAIIDKNLNVEIKKYWDIEKITIEGINNSFDLNEKELINELEKLLLDSVEKRMIADVELGAFLSGGVDSTTIVALMQSISNKPINTFTIGFYEKGYNEAQFAKEIAKHLKTNHTELYVKPKEAIDVIPLLSTIYDEPFSDASQIPTFLVSKLAKTKVTVSLSGDGGDELFGGYNRYFWAQNIWNKISKLPIFAREILVKSITSFSPSTIDNIFNFLYPFLSNKYKATVYGDKLHKLATILNASSKEEVYKRLVSGIKDPANLVLNSIEKPTILDKNFKIENFTEKMMLMDLLSYLTDDILVKVDRASMYVSLEVRVPLLDYRIVEFSKRVPFKYKIRDNKTKWILREILYKYVSKELIERPKMGFGIPIDRWLRNELKEWGEDLIESIKSDDILNYNYAKRLWYEHQSKKRNWQYQLWSILMFCEWKKRWM